MESMYLEEIETKPAEGNVGEMIARMRTEGLPIPQIWHLFAFEPERTQHLAEFIQEVMRGPSPLPPGMKEVIAALTSKWNRCPF